MVKASELKKIEQNARMNLSSSLMHEFNFSSTLCVRVNIFIVAGCRKPKYANINFL